MAWKNYRHRFVPYLATKWSTRLVKECSHEHSLVKQKQALDQLWKVLASLSVVVPPPPSPRHWKQLLTDRVMLHNLVTRGKNVLEKTCGFSITVRPSYLQGGGNGVFVESGLVKERQLVALYPGTIYLPYEPLLIPSFRNMYIFRCTDGVHIDGKHNGLSGLIYRSCARRDIVGSRLACDITWQTLTPVNPLAIGQIVNNETREIPSNVEYVELTVPPTWPLDYVRLLPNIFSKGTHPDSSDNRPWLRTVGLVSTRDIAAGEELYSSYLSIEAVTQPVDPPHTHN